MAYKDMTLTCRACGEPFVFTAGEQAFYADKGFLHEPTRCPRCRKQPRPAVSGPQERRGGRGATRRPAGRCGDSSDR